MLTKNGAANVSARLGKWLTKMELDLRTSKPQRTHFTNISLLPLFYDFHLPFTFSLRPTSILLRKHRNTKNKKNIL